MRVLLAMSYFLYPSKNGGAQMCRRVANGLRKAGYEVIVSCIDFSDKRGDVYGTKWLQQDGFDVFSITPPERRAGRVLPLWRTRPTKEMSRIVSELINRVKPDVLYLNASMEIPDFSIVASECGVPVVFHVHDFGHLCARQFLLDGFGGICSGPTSKEKCVKCLAADKSFPRGILERLSGAPGFSVVTKSIIGEERSSSFRSYDAVGSLYEFTEKFRKSVNSYIVTASAISEIEIKYGARREDMNILPHFLPDDRLVQATRVEKIAGARVRIGFFGRLSREKGFNILVDALVALEKVGPNLFELVILSNGSDENEIKSSALAFLAGERLTIHSSLTGVDLNPILANIDVCVIPSLCVEIGPLTLLEAIAQGTPCIASKAVGMKDLIDDGINGRLVDTGCVESLRAALQQCLKNPDLLDAWRKKLPKIMTEELYIEKITNILESVTKRMSP